MIDEILLAIDAELSRLQQARNLLAEGLPASQPVAGRRQLSPQARKAIADAQVKRWAKLRSEKRLSTPNPETSAG